MKLIAVLIFAVIIHELGHLVAAAAFRWKIKGLKVSWKGIGVHVVGRYIYHENVIVHCAGIAANVTMGALLAYCGLHSIGLVVASLGLIQLVPFKGSDGWKVLNARRECEQRNVSQAV